MNEKEMKEEIDRLRHKIDEETRVNAEIENYLKTHQTVLIFKMSPNEMYFNEKVNFPFLGFFSCTLKGPLF